jgi:uncharacterized protein (TIGR03085 family)
MHWLETERQSLVETWKKTDPDSPTLCEGWDARHVLAHLVQREHSLVGSIGDRLVRRKPGDEKFMGALVDGARTAEGYEALIARFLAGPPRWSPMSWAGESLNLLEYVIHHEDVRRGGWGKLEPRNLPVGQARAIWAKVPTFGRLAYRKSPVGVSVALPDGTRHPVTRDSDGVVLTGEPVELALYVSGRRAAAAVDVSGPSEAVASFLSWVEEG